MAADEEEGRSSDKKAQSHTWLYIGLGVAGLVVGYMAYRAAKGNSSALTQVPVPVSSGSSGSTVIPSGSSGSGGGSGLTSSLLSALLSQSQASSAGELAAQQQAAQIAQQQLAASQAQSLALLSDLTHALGSSHGSGSSGSGSGSGGSTSVAAALPSGFDAVTSGKIQTQYGAMSIPAGYSYIQNPSTLPVSDLGGTQLDEMTPYGAVAYVPGHPAPGAYHVGGSGPIYLFTPTSSGTK